MKLKSFVLSIPIAFLLIGSTAIAQQRYLSKSFEFRYFTNDSSANGETDFKGKSAIFTTEQRIEFLKNYAEYAKAFFHDPDLDKKVVSDSEVTYAMRNLKEQPLPDVRKRIRLQQWKWLPYRNGERESELIDLSQWNGINGIIVKNGQLLFLKDSIKVVRKFPSQLWRFFIQWKVRIPVEGAAFTASLLNYGRYPGIIVGLDKTNHIFYTSGNKQVESEEYCAANRWHLFKIEVDLSHSCYNLYVDNKLVAYNREIRNRDTINQINILSIEGSRGVALDNIWGVGYLPGNDVRLDTYAIHTFIDEDFQTKPPIKNWFLPNYDDSKWRTAERLPLVIGGERNAGRDIYMRKFIHIGNFERAYLNMEALDPGGEVYINGKEVTKLNREPTKLDVSRYLKKNDRNLIAIKVNHVPKNYYFPDGHTPDDLYWGWFASRISLDLMANTHINDVFVYTKKLSHSSAHAQIQVSLQNESVQPFKGDVLVKFFPWFPVESKNCEAERRFKIKLDIGEKVLLEKTVKIKKPYLWSFQNPYLYKVVVDLEDQNQHPVDDYVITTGIRTISQKGGTFRINGKPEMLNGALMMQFLSPLSEIASRHRCAPQNWLVKQILLIKKLNGNAIRIHVPGCAYSDPRLAEIGDQMGMMFIWVPTGWNRKEWTEGGRGWDGRENLIHEVHEYVKDIKQVRNHPSIIVWEIFNESVKKEHRSLLFDAFYPNIYNADPSRLIEPLKGYFRDEPNVANGTQDTPMGYGKEWTVSRNWPTWQKKLLNNKKRTYFVFEHGEVVGQPNWNLVKGKPWYHIHSYEWKYDVGSIGRFLTFDEWQESQAWQAFAGYNISKKMRIHDVDGMLWCPLRGGGNSVTYMKPLIDYFCNAKLSFYTLRMAYQRVLAGSNNIDVAYGPKDKIEPVILNLGKKKTVDLKIVIRNMKEDAVYQKIYKDVHLPSGRTAIFLPKFKPVFPSKGYYGVEYYLIEKNK